MPVNHNTLPRLGGNGFISADYLQRLTDLQSKVAVLQKIDPDVSFTMLPGSYSTIYILDIPACGQLSPNEMTSYSSWLQMKELILEKKPIIGTSFRGDATYRLYHWLLTTDEYKYSGEFGMFLPNEIYEALGLEETFDYNKIPFAKIGNTYQMAAKFGNSIDSLKDALIISDAKISFTREEADKGKSKYVCTVNKSVNGADFDFIFVDVSNGEKRNESNINHFFGIGNGQEEKVTVEWKDKESGKIYHINCALGKGTLLIPVGTINNWILNCHSEFTIYVDDEDAKIKDIYLAGMKNK